MRKLASPRERALSREKFGFAKRKSLTRVKDALQGAQRAQNTGSARDRFTRQIKIATLHFLPHLTPVSVNHVSQTFATPYYLLPTPLPRRHKLNVLIPELAQGRKLI